MKKKGGFINRINKVLRKSLLLSLPVVMILLIWTANFDAVKSFLLKKLSEETIGMLRLILEYCFGTSSVTVSIQLLFSYSFVFIGISSCTIFVLRLVKMLLLAFKYGETANLVTHINSGLVYRKSHSNTFLSFSRLTI